MKHSILIVDADQAWQTAMRACLSAVDFEVRAVDSPACLVREVADLPPDLVVLANDTDPAPGLAALGALREAGITVPVIMLGGSLDVDECVAGLRAGADDFVFKPVNPRELLARVRRVMARTSGPMPIDPCGRPNFAFDRFVLNFAARVLTLDGKRVPLNQGEFALLNVLSRSPGRVVTRAALAERLSPHVLREPGTINVMVSRFRKRLKQHWHGPELIGTRWGRGYVFLPDFHESDVWRVKPAAARGVRAEASQSKRGFSVGRGYDDARAR
ncbi:response regulator transcription factor [Burkholderia perseverans]|uniref:response regulator transcription factor n=1 Tax=Burkholderia perseverans TaxID=2615214 RepID=UPI001FED69A3|nr:response regulator transcription factor [Burkholderia perseverans]